MFGIRKLASGRTPDMVDRIVMAQNEVAYGRAVHYDATGNELEAVTGDAASPTDAANGVFGILMSNPNQTIENGGGVTFPLAASSTADVNPVVLRVYKDTLIEADVTGTIVIANVEVGTKLAIDGEGDGLESGSNDLDFVVEEVLVDDGTNVLKVSGYFEYTQIGG